MNTVSMTYSVSTAFMGPFGSAADLAAHRASARLFHDTCQDELVIGARLSLWAEWLDRILARRFATSVVLVGGLAGLIALAA